MTLIDRLKQLQDHELFFVWNNTLELSGVATEVESDHVVLKARPGWGEEGGNEGAKGTWFVKVDRQVGVEHLFECKPCVADAALQSGKKT